MNFIIDENYNRKNNNLLHFNDINIDDFLTHNYDKLFESNYQIKSL